MMMQLKVNDPGIDGKLNDNTFRCTKKKFHQTFGKLPSNLQGQRRELSSMKKDKLIVVNCATHKTF